MADLKKVAYCKIHPPIGIARIGDSEEEDGYFFVPEWPGAQMETPSGAIDHDVFRYRDSHGKVKRQAARFRIYGYDKHGEVVGELTDADASITWSVKLANKKASWFEFQGTQGAQSAFRGDPHPKDAARQSLRARNAHVGKLELKKGGPHGRHFTANKHRAAELEIHGELRSVAGPSRVHDPHNSNPAEKLELDFTGTFKNRTQVYLGEIATDAHGRLIVLGGRGISRPVDEEGIPLDAPEEAWITNYANNDGWHDDTSDGPVNASVVLRTTGKGRTLEVRGSAWIIVAPPDFAPDITNLVTLYDAMEEVAFDVPGLINSTTPQPPSPLTPDLQYDIWPIIQRSAGYRWVSLLGLRGHGQNKPGDGLAGRSVTFDDFVAALQKQGTVLRERLVGMLRQPIYRRPNGSEPSDLMLEKAMAQSSAMFMPPLSGDEGDRTAGDPTTWLSLTHLQFKRLRTWGETNLLPSRESASPRPRLSDGVPHPDTLTRMILERCCGGAFFPGIEITSIVRDPKLYEEAFRFNHAVLEAGDVTKYMALPWQADFYECRSAWWPAQRPDDVILEDSFKEIFAEFEAEKTGNIAGTFDLVLMDRASWDRDVGTAKPRPGGKFLLSQVLPKLEKDETAEDYVTRTVAQWSRLLGVPDEAGASPWRRQFLVQELLDAYSGRYYHLRVPAPETALEIGSIAEKHTGLLQRFAIGSLADLRQSWGEAARTDDQNIADTLITISNQYETELKRSMHSQLENIIKSYPHYPAHPKVAGSATALYEKLADIVNETVDKLDQVHPEEVRRGSPLHCRYAAVELRDALRDRAYLVNATLNGDNGMVQDWRRLGFVVERTYSLVDGKTLAANVETERAKYDGISYRDKFYYLTNIQDYSDFHLEAQRIAERGLTYAQSVIESPDVQDKNHPEKYIPFDQTTYTAKLDEIYEIQRARGFNYDLFYALRDFNRDSALRRILDNAPFNQCDGSWLRNIAIAGPADDVRSLLFEIWSDEIGNGDPALHHANLYTTLLASLGFKLAEISTRAYADDRQIPESSYVNPVFQLAISLHTDRFYPELLGMTLYLEWEVLSLTEGIIRSDYLGIDSKFWRMHVGIDNATNGHGAKARQAISLYLDKIRSEGGDTAVQEHWARIWRGFAAFSVVGNDLFGSDDDITRRRPPNPAQRLSEVMTRKRKYGSQNHLSHRLGQHRINDLFELPELFQPVLADSRWIARGDPDGSLFFKYLTTFDGPMYKIFDQSDLATWRAWIEWLGRDGDTSTVKRYFEKGEAMEKLLHELRSVAEAVAGHKRYRLDAVATARGGKSVKMAIADFFAANDIIGLMRALVSPENGWVVRGSPADSPLIADMARGGRPMGDALDRRYPTIGNRIGRQIFIEWIRAGCPIPGDSLPSDEDVADPLKSLGPKLLMHTHGMGAVH